MPAAAGVAVAAGTTVTKTAVVENAGGDSELVVTVNVSAAAGGSVTVAINDLTSSGYTRMLLTSAALAAVAATTLRVGSELAAAANTIALDVVPDQIQIVATVAGSITYGIDFELVA